MELEQKRFIFFHRHSDIHLHEKDIFFISELCTIVKSLQSSEFFFMIVTRVSDVAHGYYKYRAHTVHKFLVSLV